MTTSKRALLVATCLGGLALLATGVVRTLDQGHKKARPAAGRLLDAFSRAPRFIPRGSPVRLTYEIVCPLPNRPPTPAFVKKFCLPRGTLHIRRAGGSTFDELPLIRVKHRAVAVVPAEYTTGAGFDYYVEIRDERGAEATLPEGGADAPQRARTVQHWVKVDLGRNTFGQTRPPDAILARGGWGSELGQFGRDMSVGASAFDIAPDGSVVVLDQLNRRLLVFDRGESDHPRAMPIRFGGGEGDLAIGPDGTIYVLESSGRPVVHAYTAAGRRLYSTRVPGSGSQVVGIGTKGAIAYSYPSEMWFPVGKGAAAAPATAGQTFPGGSEVIVQAAGGEARYQLSGSHSGAWRLRSATRLGEVQLAQPYGNGLAVVTRFWTETKAEFVFLELTAAGVAQSFTIDTAEAVESGVSSRFRLHGKTLYQLRSLGSGLEIAAYSLR